MTKHDSDDGVQGLESYEIDGFRLEDAAGIVQLFHAVYGDKYPIRLFYDPEAITAANQNGSYYSIVARTGAGKIIGVTHLYPSAPCRSVYETGVGLVLKEYRNTGINKRLLDFLYNDFVPRNPRIEELFGEAVCNHPFMQKAIKQLEFIEMGIGVAVLPSESFDLEKSSRGRVAVLNAFRCYKRKPHTIFLPKAYEEILRRLYSRLDDTRDMAPAEGKLTGQTATRAETILFDAAGVSRAAFHETGGDFETCLACIESEARLKGAFVFQVFLNLTQPAVGEAANILRERGYFFGSAMPRWFDGDGLLMQKLECPPDFEGIVLESDMAKEILEYIREDRKRVAGNL
jgi:hypothetical protein